MFAILIAVIYLSFISLGLPDALLGAAWPAMRTQFGVPISYAGNISMIICAGTIVSALLGERLSKVIGAGMFAALGAAITAASLYAFSFATEFWQLALFAVPYGLGAGGVDASLNNYVALHLKAWHMSWLHCMWGLGASIGPYVMGYALDGGRGWNFGYLSVAVLQSFITAILFLTLPVWKRDAASSALKNDGNENKKFVSLSETIKVEGAIFCLISFFAYCSLEATVSLFVSSYEIARSGIAFDDAARFASIFVMGICGGRALNGFLTLKLGDRALIRGGLAICVLGIILLFCRGSTLLDAVAFVLLGLGCAPIYPCIIHMTPALFGKDKSQAAIGLQMASAYVGSCFAPPLFGLMANMLSVNLLPIFSAVLLLLIIIMHEMMVSKTKKRG